MEDKLAVRATTCRAAGTEGLPGHCHPAFLFAGQDSDGREEENPRLLFLSDSLTHLFRDVLETVYHTAEEF